MKFQEPQLFKDTFGSYNKRVTKKVNSAGLFGLMPGWITLETPLTDKVILEAIYGKAIYGYYSAGYTPAFAIDIDVHNGEGKEHARNIYKEVCKRLNAPASALAISTMGEGLHAFYFLSRPLPFLVLNNALNSLLQGLKVEIKPTTATTLRIPPQGSFINPLNFNTELENWKDIVKTAKKYDPYELFSDKVSPDTLRALYKNKGKKTMFKVYQLEGKIAPILPGNTNEAVKQMGFIYAMNNTPLDYAVNRFQELLHPDYRGELRNLDRLAERFNNIFSKVDKSGYIPIEKDDNVLFDLDEETDRQTALKLIEPLPPELFQRKPNKTGTVRKETLVRLLMTIIEWHRHLNNIYNNPVWRSYWNFVYKGFSNNIKRGFYPIPQSVLKKAVANPEDYFKILNETGFWETSFWKPWFDYSGNGQGGGCKHYKLPLLASADKQKRQDEEIKILSLRVSELLQAKKRTA